MREPVPSSSFVHIFEAWMTNPAEADPFRARIQRMRAEAAFFREVWNDETKAGWLERQADEWEELFDLALTIRATYKEAAAMSTYEHGTIKNKVSSGELEGGNGKVMLGDLPICPKKAPYLAAVAIVDRLREDHETLKRVEHTGNSSGGVRDRAREARRRRKAAA